MRPATQMLLGLTVGLWSGVSILRHHAPADILPVGAGVCLLLYAAARRTRSHASGFGMAGVGLILSLQAVRALPPVVNKPIADVRGRLECTVRRVLAETDSSIRLICTGIVDLRDAPALKDVRLQVSIRRPRERLQPGDDIVAYASVRFPSHEVLPLAVSRESILEGRGAWAEASATGASVRRRMVAPAWMQWPRTLRRRIEDNCSRRYPSDVAAIVVALLTGNQQGIPTDDRAMFARAGTAHMFSVSGSHVALVAASVMLLLSWLSQAWRAGVSSLLIVVFIVLTGAEAPAVRAGCAGIAIILCRIWERRLDALSLLCNVLSVMIVLAPESLWSTSLRLSAGACLGLVVLAPLWHRASALWFPTIAWMRTFASSFGVSMAASAGIAIPSMVVFGTVSLISPLANLAVVPLLSAAMLLAALVEALGAVAPFATDAWTSLVVLCVRWSMHISVWAAHLDPGVTTIGWPCAGITIVSAWWICRAPLARQATIRLVVMTTILYGTSTIEVPRTEIPDSSTRLPYIMRMANHGEVLMVHMRSRKSQDGRPQRDMTCERWLASQPGILVVFHDDGDASRAIDRVQEQRQLFRFRYVRNHGTTPSAHPS